MFKPTPPPDAVAHSDKAGPIAAFFLLALSGRFAMLNLPWFLFWPSFMALSFSLEYLLSALRPLRVFSLGDSYSNIVGVLLAIVVMTILQYQFPAVLGIKTKATYS